MNRLNALTLLLMSLPAGSQLVAHAGVSLTGDVVVWPGTLPSSAIYSAGDSNVATVDGNVTNAMIGPATVRNSYRAIDVSGSAKVSSASRRTTSMHKSMRIASVRMPMSSSFAERIVQ